MERTHICGGCGSREDVGYLVDATIAALQARVQELEESRDAWKASQECSEKAYMSLVNQIPAERFDYDPVNVALLDGAKEQEIIGRKQIADLQDLLKRTDENREQWRKLCQEAQSQLTQRTTECDALKLVNDTHMKTVMKLSHIVEQQTAELEAAKQQLSAAQETILRTYTASAAMDLVGVKAELERVRALIKALPKVEGYWTVSCALAVTVVTGGIVRDISEVVAAIVQHRQGMEG